MEGAKKDLGTDLLGRPLREPTNEEIENLLNLSRKENQEKPAETNTEQPPHSGQYTFKDILMNIGEKYYPKNKFDTQDKLNFELLYFGAKKLKQKVGIGFFNSKSIRSLDNLATVLYELGGISSVQEGRQIIPNIVNEKVRYYTDSLTIKEAINLQGQKSYQIEYD